MQEYQTGTDKLEAKTAEKGCPQKKKPRYYKNAGIKKGSYIRIGDSDEPWMIMKYIVYKVILMVLKKI